MMAEVYDGLARLRDWSDEGLDIRPVLFTRNVRTSLNNSSPSPRSHFCPRRERRTRQSEDLCVESFLACPLVVLERHRLDADAGRALV